ncbi:hypothetical protein [Streptomyces sp. NPDC002676]
MNIDSFWELIEECRRQERGSDERLAWLRGELSRFALMSDVQVAVGGDSLLHRVWGGRLLVVGLCGVV